MSIDSAYHLQDKLAIVLAGELGEYSRPPPLPPIPAISVRDKFVPSNLKVIVALLDAPLVPAAEVIISLQPKVISKGGNFNNRSIDEAWTVWMIFHDVRQDPRPAYRAIVANFKTASIPTYLAASNINNGQYVFDVARHTLIRIK